jgi:hypothetical protein
MASSNAGSLEAGPKVATILVAWRAMAVSPDGYCLLDSYMFERRIRVGFQHTNPCKYTLYVSFMSDGLGSPTGKHRLFQRMRR